MKFISNFWSIIINSGVKEDDDFTHKVHVRISNAVCILGSLFAFGYCLFLFFNHQYRLAFNDVLFILNFMILYLLNSLGYNKLGTALSIITVPLMLLYVNHEYGEIGTEYFYFACIVLGFYLFKNRTQQIVISIFFIGLIFLTKYLEAVVVPTDFALSVAPYIKISNTFMSLAVLILSIMLFIGDHEKYKRLVETKNIQLNEAVELTEQKNEAISLLLKELNHRIKNNLQMVSGLLSTQARTSSNPIAKQKLSDAVSRIDSMILLHQQLYKSVDDSKPNVKVYIDNLIDHILFASGKEELIEVKKDIEDLALSIDFTVHLGLIVNELITNSLKYGLNNDASKDQITILLSKKASIISLQITDKGKGFSDDFDLKNVKSGGLDLVQSIIQKYKGTVHVSSDYEGTSIQAELVYPE